MGELPEPVRILLRKCRALPFVLAFITFVNIFLPLLGFWNAHYTLKYAAQPHLAALIFSIALASCFAIPFGIMRSARRRLFAASASIILGLIVFYWTSPERRLQRLLSTTKEVRVYTASFGERQHLVARITDQQSIDDLRDSLNIETRPWELLIWFIPGSDHQLEFYDDRGSSIGDFGTLSGGLGITERFPLSSRGYSWKGHIPSWSDYATSSKFQRTYQHVLLSHFMQDTPAVSRRA
jgi:hypothetical protein